MENKLKQIINHFGIENQMKKLNEECYELIDSIKDYLDGIEKEEINHIEEEFADVSILLDQIVAYFNLNLDNVKDIYVKKVYRTLDRIDSGYYEKKHF